MGNKLLVSAESASACEQGGLALTTLLGPFCDQPVLQVMLRRLSGLEQLHPSRQRLWINRHRPGDQVLASPPRC